VVAGNRLAAPGDFGPVIMPLDQALEFIATEDFFWINASGLQLTELCKVQLIICCCKWAFQ
jgi:hypothetical protein